MNFEPWPIFLWMTSMSRVGSSTICNPREWGECLSQASQSAICGDLPNDLENITKSSPKLLPLLTLHPLPNGPKHFIWFWADGRQEKQKEAVKCANFCSSDTPLPHCSSFYQLFPVSVCKRGAGLKETWSEGIQLSTMTSNGGRLSSASSSTSSTSSSSRGVGFGGEMGLGSLTLSPKIFDPVEAGGGGSGSRGFGCPRNGTGLREQDRNRSPAASDDRSHGQSSSNGKLCSRGHWRPAEDAKLKELVALYGPQNWNLIAEKLQGRSGDDDVSHRNCLCFIWRNHEVSRPVRGD